jgi:hypothetical protein
MVIGRTTCMACYTPPLGLFRHAMRLKVTAHASFTPIGQAPITATKTIVLAG